MTTSMGWLPSAIEAATEFAPEPLVVLDYDGTLAEIAPRPELAALDPATREALAALSERAPVAVLSGRALDDVAERVGLPSLVYAGCHGLEIRGPGLEFVHPEAAAFAPEVDAAAALFEMALAGIDGAIVEHKGLAVAVHHRLVDPAHHRDVEAAVARVAGAHPVLSHKRGKMVDELVAGVAWDKGKALGFLREALAPDRFVIFVGDDRTDEDAFAAIEGEGAAVIVAEAPRETAARYQLPNPAAVRALLVRLARSRSG